jgi:uncharacterized membrane protein
MSMKKSPILLLDALVNLVLGIILLIYSPSIIKELGLPVTHQYFYPNILGAVLFGIGIALIIEFSSKESSFVGLGLGGAITINLCGGIVLLLWLIWGQLSLPVTGKIILWILAIFLIGISGTEYGIHRYSSRQHRKKSG